MYEDASDQWTVELIGEKVSSTSIASAGPICFTDHHELHLAGCCGGGNCPWCIGESFDLGGEG